MKIVENLVSFFDKSYFSSKILKKQEKDNNRVLTNAYLYNLLGSEYEKIMSYAMKEKWKSAKVSEMYDIINDTLDLTYNENVLIETVLTDIKKKYQVLEYRKSEK